tara:strand:- start:3640 stop:4299 length:660 start_codon:yes stop_codon:yes gene_type:complete
MVWMMNKSKRFKDAYWYIERSINETKLRESIILCKLLEDIILSHLEAVPAKHFDMVLHEMVFYFWEIVPTQQQKTYLMDMRRRVYFSRGPGLMRGLIRERIKKTKIIGFSEYEAKVKQLQRESDDLISRMKNAGRYGLVTFRELNCCKAKIDNFNAYVSEMVTMIGCGCDLCLSVTFEKRKFHRRSDMHVFEKFKIAKPAPKMVIPVRLRIVESRLHFG